MIIQISDQLRAQFFESTREGVVVLEASRILHSCTFRDMRPRYPEIRFKNEPLQPFRRSYDATVWELRLGELAAEENRAEFMREQSALRLAAEAKARAAALAKMEEVIQEAEKKQEEDKKS